MLRAVLAVESSAPVLASSAADWKQLLDLHLCESSTVSVCGLCLVRECLEDTEDAEKN